MRHPSDEQHILFGAFVLVCVFLLLAVIGRML
jgi:hypothetical protein